MPSTSEPVSILPVISIQSRLKLFINFLHGYVETIHDSVIISQDAQFWSRMSIMIFNDHQNNKYGRSIHRVSILPRAKRGLMC